MTDLSFISAQQEAYSFIHERILNGTYPSGMHIRPGIITEDLEISRMPVREALRQLEAEGLIIMRPNRGAVVTALTAEEVEELIEMRAMLEAIALRYAMPKLKGETFEELERLGDRMDRARGEPSAWIARHAEFHRFISDLAKKRHISTVLERLRNQLQPSTYLFIRGRGTEEMEGHEHRILLDVIKSGDVDTAETLMRNHVRQFSVTLSRFIAERAEGATKPRRRAA